MNRTWKQISFGAIYLLVIVLIIGGIYFFYLKPASSCSDNKQNQKETGIDCGGSCIPCEVKGLNLITEELVIIPASENQATLLAKVRNPSQNFSAEFSYKFELDKAILNQSSLGLRGKEIIAPGTAEFIVVPGLIVDAGGVRSINLNISGLNWIEDRSPPLSISVNAEPEFDESRAAIVITGILSNNSAVNLPRVNLTAILFDKAGDTLDASVTRLEKVEAFSQREFTIFFPPAYKAFANDFDPQKTKIQWDLDE